MKSICVRLLVSIQPCLLVVLYLSTACHAVNVEPKKISTAQMRKLQAGCGDVVSVTATVVYQDPLWKFLFLTDGGSGIFANPVPGNYEIGDRLEISGPIGDGHGVPIFHEDIRVKKVGSVEIPEALKANLEHWIGM